MKHLPALRFTSSTALLLIIAWIGRQAPLHAQTFAFGKNKVSYAEFDWSILEGEHFDIYYYPEEEQIAKLALLEAERSYRYLREKTNHEILRRIPLIVYSSHEHFEQTNVIPFMLTEGVLGFTEYLKGRVALPFGGSVSEFYRVIRHELVHVFQHDMIQRQYRLYRRVRISQTPLWFTEGLAEYFSSTLLPVDEMFLRDMVIHKRIDGVGSLWRFGGSYALYKAGESFIRFLVDRYGEGTLIEFIKNLWAERTFREAFKSTFQRSLGELSDEWVEELNRRYANDGRENAEQNCVKISLEGEIATMPTSYRDVDGNEKVLYFSSRWSTTRITETSLEKPQRRQTLLTSSKDPIFESLHPFNSGMDVSRDGVMVFSSRYHDRDAIVLWDLRRGSLIGDYKFGELIEITSPSISASGKRIAFAGLSPSGRQDIYVYNIESGVLVPITSDFYSDRDPDWSPDGRRIVFSSDRTVYGREGFTNLFIADTVTGEIYHLTCGSWNDMRPKWSPDGSKILFISDRDGYRSIYVIDEHGSGAPVVEVNEGVFQADWTPGSDGILFSILDDLLINLWKTSYDPPIENDFHLKGGSGLSTWATGEEGVDEVEIASKPYDPDYSFDIATGGIGFSNAYGTNQAGQIMISDTLGDKLLLFQIDNTATQFGDVLKSLNVTAGYLNLKHRLNIGVGAFHTRGRFIDIRKTDFPFWEQQYGGFLLLSYPFSRYKRLETSLSLFRSRRKDVVETFDRDSFLAANSLSLVKDNTIWLGLGPVEGERYNLGVTLTNDITRAEPENVAFGIDYRRYFRTGLTSTYAVRLQVRASEGSLPERYFLGGSWSLRGYPRFSIIGTRAVLFNQEWRFLIVRRALEGPRSKSFWLPPIEGALFFDAGNAWDPDDEDVDVLGSFGFGLRVGIAGPFILRFDFSKRTDFDTVSGKIYTNFFIGYDY